MKPSHFPMPRWRPWPMTPPNNAYTFEICVETPDALRLAAPFADRIELCAALDLGGLTPDAGLMRLAAESGIKTHVLIRPRSGDFTMTPDELSVGVASIQAVRNMGLKGVVIGAERKGALDKPALEAMIDAADGMDVTLHRVIDVLEDKEAALELAIDLGMVRILNSGGTKTAAEGAKRLSELHQAANGRIEIMAGSGINSQTLPHLLASTPITSFHASCTTKTPIDNQYAALGFDSASRKFDPAEAQNIRKLLTRQPST